MNSSLFIKNAYPSSFHRWKREMTPSDLCTLASGTKPANHVATASPSSRSWSDWPQPAILSAFLLEEWPLYHRSGMELVRTTSGSQERVLSILDDAVVVLGQIDPLQRHQALVRLSSFFAESYESIDAVASRARTIRQSWSAGTPIAELTVNPEFAAYEQERLRCAIGHVTQDATLYPLYEKLSALGYEFALCQQRYHPDHGVHEMEYHLHFISRDGGRHVRKGRTCYDAVMAMFQAVGVEPADSRVGPDR